MAYPANIHKNKAIVLLKKIGVPMNEVIRAFGDNPKGSDKLNYYRVWHRDKDKYEFPKKWQSQIGNKPSHKN